MRLLTLVLVFLLLTLQYDLWIGQGSLRSVWHLQEKIQVQREKNRALKESNRALRAKVQDIKNNLAAVEERARSELGMIRQGETFYRLVER